MWSRLNDPQDLPGLNAFERDFLKFILRKATERSHRWQPTLKQRRVLERTAERLAGPVPIETDAPRLSDWPIVPGWEKCIRCIVAAAGGPT